MKVLAEGVEKEKQVEILRSLSCDEIQGFYYARPLPWENFETKVIRAKEACKNERSFLHALFTANASGPVFQ